MLQSLIVVSSIHLSLSVNLPASSCHSSVASFVTVSPPLLCTDFYFNSPLLHKKLPPKLQGLKLASWTRAQLGNLSLQQMVSADSLLHLQPAGALLGVEGPRQPHSLSQSSAGMRDCMWAGPGSLSLPGLLLFKPAGLGSSETEGRGYEAP